MELHKTIVADQEELLKLLSENPDCLEDGLTLIPEAWKHRAAWSVYPAVDREGAYIAVMITTRALGEWSRKAIDWCIDVDLDKAKRIIDRHSHLLRHEPDDSGDFRLVVVAPSYNNEFRRLAAEYTSITDFYCFQAFSADEGKIVVCFPENIPMLPSAYEESPVSVGFHLNYIKKKQAKAAALELLDYISSLDGASMEATEHYIIIEDLYGNYLGYVRTYRTFSKVYLAWKEENGGFVGCDTDIVSPKDIDDELRDDVIQAIKHHGCRR